ncbi:MAG: NmrA family NAD(P)-binding protein [Pseudomonadota bacterium]
MFIVMGATGHVGSAVAGSLLAAGHEVTVVTRDADRARRRWPGTRARIVEADANDPDVLRAVFRQGRRAFLLNPPADPGTDTDAVERRTVAGILRALEGSGLEKVVAESTGGARPGERIGDLSVLWELEEGLRRQPIPAAINRAAFYMSNWDSQLAAVRESGTLSSLYPADARLPMAAPEDLGKAAAHRLLSPLNDVGVQHVEGPERYTPADVATAFSRALHRPVDVAVVPRDRWQETFRQLGFSEAAAKAYTRMTATSLDDLHLPDDAIRGTVTLDAYIRELVGRD